MFSGLKSPQPSSKQLITYSDGSIRSQSEANQRWSLTGVCGVFYGTQCLQL